MPPEFVFVASCARMGWKYSHTPIGSRAMQVEKLIYMANQIGKFFAPQGAEAEIAGVEDHLRRFWDPRMRAQIVDPVREGGVGLDTNVALAVARLGAAADRHP